MDKWKKGSITVFLSISGVLIFALLGTLVETARMNACSGHAERTLRTASEALLTEYSRPLYEQYGLFFLESAGSPYEQVIARYVNDTLENSKGNLNFLDGSLNGVKVVEKTYLGDDKAKALQMEISDYMGRKVTKDQLEKFLQQSKSLQETSEKAEEIEAKVEEEKELSKLDTELLDLMEKVDGVSIHSGGINVANSFVKMFAVGPKKAQAFGISESAVWEVVKPKLVDVPETEQEWKKRKADFSRKVQEAKKVIIQAMTLAEKFQQSVSLTAEPSGELADYHNRMVNLAGKMGVLAENKEILVQTESILQKGITKESVETLNEIWTEYDTDSIAFDYTGVGESGGADNPLDSLSSAWGDGILSLILEKKETVSKKEVDNPDNFTSLYKQDTKEDKHLEDRVKKLTDDEEVSLGGVLGDMGSYALDEFCLDSYIQDKFGSFAQKNTGWKNSLDYQWEYVIAGNDSDKKNLESILNRILLIRSVTNFLAIYQDGAKKSEAYAAAAAVIGFTGIEPLVRLLQTLILLVWTMVESLVDISGLLQERNVPVIKTAASIQTSFTDLFQINAASITSRAKKFSKAGKTTFGYRQYLLLFMAAMNQGVRLYRVMDMIQWDMRKNGHKNFDLASCVFSIKVKGNFIFPTRLFRFAPIEKMLGRNIYSYHMPGEVTVSYL